MTSKSISVAATLAAFALATPAVAAPGDISVESFLTKADALAAKGALALLSSDINLLKSEGNAAGAAYKARLARERTAGKPSSCPPKGTKINSNQLLAHLRTYPAARRPAISLRTAMADMFIKMFPCP